MSNVSRRDVLRYGAAAAAVVGSAVGAQSLATSSSAAPPPAAPAEPDPRDFELDYRGKKIKGVHGNAAAKHAHQVHINGRKLAVMPIDLPAESGAVIGFISALNHYEPVVIDEDRNKDGLLKLAQRAVDALGDSELTAAAGTEHDHGR